MAFCFGTCDERNETSVVLSEGKSCFGHPQGKIVSRYESPYIPPATFISLLLLRLIVGPTTNEHARRGKGLYKETKQEAPPRD